MEGEDLGGCSIWKSEKDGNRWGPPQQLKGGINNGNAAYPQILADGRTMLFSSNRAGGAGGWDFYLSTWDGQQWSEPINATFANTAEDEKVGTITARGDVLFYSGTFKGAQNLIVAKVPENLMPGHILFMEGTVSGPTGDPLEAVISVFDAESKEEVLLMKNNPKGNYKLFLPEGKLYDFAIFPINRDHTFYSEIIDFKNPDSGEKLEKSEALMPLGKGQTFTLNALGFNAYDTTLSNTSMMEFLRLKRLFQSNPELSGKFEVKVNRVFEDTVQSDPELTEIRYDTAFYVLDTASMDSLALDSIFQFFQIVEDSTKYYQVEKTYHNDRTDAMARSVLDMLKQEGFPMEKFEAEGKSGIKGPKPESFEYWVELTFQ
jgi:hypothetical protein